MAINRNQLSSVNYSINNKQASFKSSIGINNNIKKIPSHYNFPISIDELKKVLLTFAEIAEPVKTLSQKHGQLLGEKLQKASEYRREEFYIGNRLNADDIDYYLNNFKTFSEDEKLKLMADFANLNNGQYLDYWVSNPEQLSIYVNHDGYLPLKLKQFNEKTWNTILKSYIEILKNSSKTNIIDALLKYSSNYFCRQINTFLNHGSINANDSKEIDEIKELIKTLKQVSITSSIEEKSIPLWRDDNESLFDSIEVYGEKLSNLIHSALRGNNANAEIVLDYFNKTKPSIERKGFLSTAIKPFEYMKKKIKWHLNLDVGVNYLYISDIIDQIKRPESFTTEAELLVHPCTLEINKAEIKEKKLNLNATIKPLKTF